MRLFMTTLPGWSATTSPIRAFGWTALTFGFLTVPWNIYAMIFAYK